MDFSEEFEIISKIILPNETYHKKIQEDLDKVDKIKRHKPKEKEDNGYQDLLDDKILGILGG